MFSESFAILSEEGEGQTPPFSGSQCNGRYTCYWKHSCFFWLCCTTLLTERLSPFPSTIYTKVSLTRSQTREGWRWILLRGPFTWCYSDCEHSLISMQPILRWSNYCCHTMWTLLPCERALRENTVRCVWEIQAINWFWWANNKYSFHFSKTSISKGRNNQMNFTYSLLWILLLPCFGYLLS